MALGQEGVQGEVGGGGGGGVLAFARILPPIETCKSRVPY